MLKNCKWSLFEYFSTLKLFKILFLYFFESRRLPLQFFYILQQWMLKNLKASPFAVFGNVRFFKMNNFCPKIRFSQAQHAILEICSFRDLVFFKICFHRSLPSLNFYKNRNVLRAQRTPQGFRHYATYRRPSSQKFFREISICFPFAVFLKGVCVCGGVPLRKWFFAVSSWGKMVFETYAYPFGYFLAL